MDRFLKYVDKKDNGCWMWVGAQTATGYGSFHFNGMPRKAHRVSYQIHVGGIPEGMYLDHLCRTPLCVNPSHLEPVTPGENVRRGLRSYDSLVKNRCPVGHPHPDGEGLYRSARGLRDCTDCRTIRNRGASALVSALRVEVGITHSEIIRRFGGSWRNVARELVSRGISPNRVLRDRGIPLLVFPKSGESEVIGGR